MQSLCKDERLCSKKSISKLLIEGNKYFMPPFSVEWIEMPGNQKYSLQLLVVVPKRFFKKAVERNRLKRLIRETFRIHKEILGKVLKEKNKKLAIMFLYNSDEMKNFEEVETKVSLILQFLARNI